MLDFINCFVPVLMLTASMLLICLEYVHMLQLESYQLDGFARWVKANKQRAYVNGLVISLISLTAFFALSFFAGDWTYIASAAVMLAGSIAGFIIYKKKPVKKGLVYTKRVKRLLAIHCILYAVVFLLIDLAGDYLMLAARALAFFLPAVAVWALALSALLAQPLESGINRYYFKDAQRIANRNPDLIKIGITGSFGKTSTKFILGTLLKEKYNTLLTPSSFNTPMGITRIIREQLNPEHEVFIAEMGARHVGDINELVDLVHPNIGILTSVGRQHLETFGSIENVAKTKYELIEGLPQGGASFFAADGAWCEQLYEKTAGDKMLAGLDEKCDVHATNIVVTTEGSTFTLVTPGGNIECTTPLLGRHNIQNTVLCAAVALHLGVTLEQIRSGMGKLEPVEHRLQLIKGSGGVTVIDDAFNANPTGAKAAMEVLGSFGGRRICITPGMVELGAEEYELNKDFGRQMAAACDIAVLVGVKRTQPIYEGLLESGFDADAVLRVNTLAQASEFLATSSRMGDVVLFENDLPDNYNE